MPIAPSSTPGRALAAALATASCAALCAAPASADPSPDPRPDVAPAVVITEIQQALGIPPVDQLTLRPAGHPAEPSAEDRAGRAVDRMESAGDRIAKRAYVYGGGHASFDASGYDCSGSVSYVLHAAGLLETPLASGALTTYGRPGRGHHVTVYANGGHVFMTIDGRRFDTIAFKASGSRWSDSVGSTDGYVARHPPGL